MLPSAFRPVGSDAFNFLAKVQVVDDRNPLGGGVLTGQAGHEARRIYMTEAIWSPSAWLEFGARYAMRNADATVTHPDSVVQALRSSADYVGSRLDVGLSPWLRVRGDGRLLRERTTGTTQWDAAPQLVLAPVTGIEIARYEQSIQAAFREVSDALIARSTLEDQIKAEEALTAASEASYRLADVRFVERSRVQ